MTFTAAVAYALAMALPASTAAASVAGDMTKTGSTGHQANRNATSYLEDGGPWLASATVESLPNAPLVFDVSANNGVPWIRDPRSSPSWQNPRRGGPWLASATVESLPNAPLVFDVSANNGVPWIRDPRSSPSWQNLRRVPGSQGNYVINISIAEDAAAGYTPDPTTTSAVRVTARTPAGIFYTVCRLGNLSMLSIPLPTSGPLPCTPWAIVPN
ncbi:hypothetical protein ACFFHJ_17990 [Planotetraspora thailandica]|uniref:hypothetical protein n=1 Tax=Planotetraspora thailandica TaxID=487172 RepID=UPI0019502478|nr:hypothetical protein [Planotetraspora thailandica]